jgi:anaerobic selenocysteine-containing dehydrogenase
MTDTAAYADYVLPAASFLEFDDLVVPYFHDTISAQARATAPLGQSLPNQDIFRKLAAAMGFSEPALYESDASMLQQLLAQTRFKGSFEDLKVLGTVGFGATGRVQFENLTFATPSGKIEVSSSRLKAEGHPEAPIPHADAPPAGGLLRVLSPASAWLMNSSYGNDARILRQLSEPQVYLNARELASRGIKDGDPVLLKNGTGALQLTATVSADVPDGVALVYKGRWPRTAGDAANVNVLNPGLRTDIADSSAVHGVTAELVAL